jgi:hypothetical protein
LKDEVAYVMGNDRDSEEFSFSAHFETSSRVRERRLLRNCEFEMEM